MQKEALCGCPARFSNTCSCNPDVEDLDPRCPVHNINPESDPNCELHGHLEFYPKG